MSFSVADLLELPVMRAARVEVLAGSALAERPVRWVHTSEIYEIAPLLRGGEVLLTTGLGLVGQSSEAMAHYVRSLARRGVAALLLEVGRTFPSVPAALVSAARDSDLPLIVLHGVIPFIQVTETVHPLLLGEELRRLRYVDQATAELHRALLTHAGASELVALAETLCGAAAGLYDDRGRLVAGTEVDREGCVTEEVASSPRMALAVATGPEQARLVELCASAVAVALAAERRGRGQRGSAAADLLHDLAEARSHLTSADISTRARALGFTVRPGECALGLVVEASATSPLTVVAKATAAALRAEVGACLVGTVGPEVLAAAAARPATLRPALERAAEAISAELAATVGGRVVRLVAGPLVADTAGLARSIPEARSAARLANTLVVESRVVLANDLGVYQLLSSAVDDPELERFVNDQLGPLLDADARTGSELVSTLDAYLDAGLSKTAAAAALGIRRQTLYARLERIGETLAGVDLGDRRRRTAIDLALVSWRLRTAAASYRR